MPLLMLMTLLCEVLETASTATSSDIQAGLLGSFDPHLDQLLVSQHDSEWRDLVDGLSLALSATEPLVRPKAPSGAGAQGDRSASPTTFGLGLQYTPFGYYFANLSLVGYANRSTRKSWNPDFTYCVGYNDPTAYTLSLTYCNYGGNRISPIANQVRTDFASGTWTLAYKFALAPEVADLFLIDTRGTIGCQIAYRGSQKYRDARTNTYQGFRDSAAVGCKYPIYGNWYFNFELNRYMHPGQKQPWDPDYTYGFGYFEWHRGTFSI